MTEILYWLLITSCSPNLNLDLPQHLPAYCSLLIVSSTHPVPCVRTALAQCHTFAVISPFIWNGLPPLTSGIVTYVPSVPNVYYFLWIAATRIVSFVAASFTSMFAMGPRSCMLPRSCVAAHMWCRAPVLPRSRNAAAHSYVAAHPWCRVRVWCRESL